jgi:hypothetical protein
MGLALPPPNGPVAQLYSLSSDFSGGSGGGRTRTEESDDQIVINFPNLPDEISLDRDTEWRVTPSPLLPDGFHVYDHTAPLAIPLSFKLHAFDDYSINGPETLLQIAAKLHALTLPIISGRTSVRSTSSASPGNGTSASAEATKDTATGGAPATIDSVASDGEQPYYFPPACVLNLMVGSGGPNGLGILCVGYVKSVSAKLKGPWLSSGDASANRNLPSAADFSFVFVHAPNYTNSLDLLQSRGSFALPQVGAARMKQSLYNTIDVVGDLSRIGYRGLLAAG